MKSPSSSRSSGTRRRFRPRVQEHVAHPPAPLNPTAPLPLLPRAGKRMVVLSFTFLWVWLTTGCTGAPPNGPTPPSIAELGGMTAPLTSFHQQITSSLSSVTVTPGAAFTVPVTVKNTGGQRLSSVGKYPVTLSYKWFEAGRMLPIEGERTPLPVPISPGQRISFDARIVAPPAGQHLTVKLTLVQEGVAWFMMRNAPALELNAKLKR